MGPFVLRKLILLSTTIQGLASKQLSLLLPSLKVGLVVTHNSILSKTEATERGRVLLDFKRTEICLSLNIFIINK